LDELLLMVDCSVNDTIANSFSNDVFSLFTSLEIELDSNVVNRDLRVRNVDLLQAELDDSVSQTVDQSQVVVSHEYILVLLSLLLEFFHVSALGSAHDSKVGSKRDLVFFLVENLAVRDISHQKLDEDEELLSLDTEAKGSNFRTLTLSLDQVSLGFRVLHLHGLNAANVVQVASVLVVGARRRESSFCDEVVSLLVQVLGQIRSDNYVHQGGLTDRIVM